MRKVEYKNINLGSVFRLFGGMYFIAGFVFSLFGENFGVEQIRDILRALPYIGQVFTTGFLGSLMVGLISAVLGGICFLFMAVIYNIFAMILGGIEIDVEDKS